MFKILIIFTFFVYVYCQPRACNCYSGKTATRNCCNELNGKFEEFGKLGVCHQPEKGQGSWKYCCEGYFRSYDCWDDTNEDYF